jgi:murein DD-endopeptidase MepM/ murein hydrolase activator NlpD
MSVIAASCASRVRVISGYSATRGAIYQISHHAVDITKDGVADIVIASADGVVVYLDHDASVGWAVYINHGAFAGPFAWGSDSYVTAYAHLATVDVRRGQRVTRGQRLGRSGYSTVDRWPMCTGCFAGRPATGDSRPRIR